jgi:hypothetical protein
LDIVNNKLLSEMSNSNFVSFSKNKNNLAKLPEKRVDFKTFSQELKDRIQKGEIKSKLQDLKSDKAYNPVAALARSGAFRGAKNNAFGIATRLYPAFLTPEQAAAKKIKPEAVSKAKIAWAKVSKFIESAGGNPEVLKKSIIEGYNKPVLKFKKNDKENQSSFDGNDSDYSCFMNIYPYRLPQGQRLEDEYFDVTGNRFVINNEDALVASLPILLKINSIIQESGADINPYLPTVDNNLTFDLSESDKLVPSLDDSSLISIMESALEEKSKNLPLDTGSFGEIISDELKKKDEERRVGNDILGLPRRTFFIGLTVVLAIGGFIAYKKYFKK